jgi:hypothetical protein
MGQHLLLPTWWCIGAQYQWLTDSLVNCCIASIVIAVKGVKENVLCQFKM